MTYIPDYKKWEKFKKELEGYDKKFKTEINKLKEEKDKTFDKLSKEQISLLREEETIEKKIKTRETWGVVLTYPCIGIILAIIGLIVGFDTKAFNDFAFLIVIGSLVLGAAISVCFINPVLLGISSLEKKRVKLREDTLILEYIKIRDTITEKTQEYYEERERMVNAAAKDAPPSNEEPDNFIMKAVCRFFEDADRLQKQEALEHTYQIREDGYVRNLRKTDNGGGYDSTHGWHDVYKDDIGRAWGTTDNGKTFFKK